MSNANYCSYDQILIRRLLTELLAGVRPDTENVVWEVTGVGDDQGSSTGS